MDMKKPAVVEDLESFLAPVAMLAVVKPSGSSLSPLAASLELLAGRSLADNRRERPEQDQDSEDPSDPVLEILAEFDKGAIGIVRAADRIEETLRRVERLEKNSYPASGCGWRPLIVGRFEPVGPDGSPIFESAPAWRFGGNSDRRTSYMT
jgi:hypothetical protein